MNILIIKIDLNVPFQLLIGEAGVTINDTPKIHVKNMGVEDNALTFEKEQVQIPLQLNGVFSCFQTSKPTLVEVKTCDPNNVLHLSPKGGWNPHNNVHAQNEANMTDFEGNMIEKKHRQFSFTLMIVYFATLSYIVEKSSDDYNVSGYWQIIL